jgi:hypothetical protein
MQYKPNVFIDIYRKRFGGKVYRDVRFHVKGGCITVENLSVASDDAAYKKAKAMVKEASEL